MWFSVQYHDNQNSKKSQKKVGSILWIIHISQGLCQKPHGRWFIEPQLGPGIACPLLQASGTQAELLPPLLQHIAQHDENEESGPPKEQEE